MEILVSFCNVWTPGRPLLGLLDTELSSLRIVPLPRELLPCTGIRGLAISDRFLVAAMQEGSETRPRLAILDRTDLTACGVYGFRSTGDVHSICLAGDRLYAVSTGTDEVIELRMRGPEVVAETACWRPDPDGPRVDRHHLNGICRWHGELLVSGFGPKSGERWSSAVDGFVVNISRGKRVASGVYHPHSLTAIGDTLAYCESSGKAVRTLGPGPARCGLPGYTRGLCRAGDGLFVGSCVGRRVSRSTGLINNSGEGGELAGQCAVSRLSLQRFEIESTFDLSDVAREIYDLLPVEGTERWPVEPAQSVDFSGDAVWRERVLQTAVEIMAQVPPGETLILVDQDRSGVGPEIIARRCLPFVEYEGQYWGPPPDDATAIYEVERLRQCGATFIAFASPALWWLEYYLGLLAYLRGRFRRVLENDHLVIFDLR